MDIGVFMIPNMDPRALKRMMDSMGMKNTEIESDRVVIFGRGKDIVIENPSVTMIEMQGNVSFQITGDMREAQKEASPAEITDEDIQLVREKTGASKEVARKALLESDGDIAKAIMKLKG